ncbi:hypothetical protein NLA06_00155 [Desulfomicrobium sp. ZS1]|uniref:hypothetical protein n=1 Tax=Desulfomicrobium sp. ZS1 TaxID=2952228 RepID=UPI0020B2D97C|nr:hypothetical protein [Desulfomicrobium sp. ZS1]UTF50331.1 hypothetical protein NLA06_00155 [Desulfomicrobium sp. ZS1]
MPAPSSRHTARDGSRAASQDRDAARDPSGLIIFPDHETGPLAGQNRQRRP